jgi:elongation factor 1 alpha-like protein
MSRHRNLRHLADDYYEDDDYYDDDYDDYDAKPAAPAPKRPAAKKSPPRSATTRPKKVSSTPPPSAKKAAATPAAVSTPPPGFSVTPPPPTAAAVTTTSEKVPPANNSSSTNSDLVERLQARGWLETTKKSPPTTRKRARIPYTLVVLGHVDAGKSTLLGHLLHQDSNTAGNTSNNTNWAHVLDSTTAEQERGITMDLAVRTLETDRFAWLVQDAPGHADFVTQAVTGVSLAEVAVAVVDASSSLAEFAIPRQLREHLVLSRGLGVSQIIVAVNKLEVVNWSAPVYQQICASLTHFLVSTLGYAQQQVRFVPVSGLLGINLKRRPANCPLTAWYNGPTLYQALDQCTAPPYFNGALLTVVPKIMLKPTRVVVVDVPGEQGAAVMVRAKVIQGWLHQQQRLVLLPIGDSVTVQRLHNLLQGDKTAVAGEMVDLLLAGTDVARLAVGHVLVAMSPLPVVASRFRAKLIVLDTVTVPIIPGATALFYCHTLHLPCTVAQFKPRVLTANMQAVVTIVLSSSIVLETFSSNKTMGRFILRRQGVTIAMGIIEEILS